MFNISGGELIIVLLLGLVILGPERLPKAARQVARVMAQVRDLSNSFQRELKDAFDEPSEPVVKPARPQLTALDGGANRSVEPAAPTDPVAAAAPADPIAATEPIGSVPTGSVPTDPVAPETSSTAAPVDPVAAADQDRTDAPPATGTA